MSKVNFNTKSNLTYHMDFSGILKPKKDKKSSSKYEEKRKEEQEKFLGVCKICGAPMKYTGGNVVVCGNIDCRGYKKVEKDVNTGETKTVYYPIVRLLDNRAMKYVKKLFD